MELMKKDKCELEVLVATFGENGLLRLASMISPETKGVRYVVSCQCPGHTSLSLPPELIRDDITVVFTPTKGVAINRNNALDHATAPLCILSDDDISYTPDAFDTIISSFRARPDMDIATFQFRSPGKMTEKPYPTFSFPLDTPAKGYYVSAVEVAFRRERVLASGIRFNENFGVGINRFGSGEEELWVHDLLESGLRGFFIPSLIANHLHCDSTGIRLMATPPVLRAQGAIIKRFYPHTALLRVMLKSWRVSKTSGISLFSCLPPLLYGWWYATFYPKKLFGVSRNEKPT